MTYQDFITLAAIVGIIIQGVRLDHAIKDIKALKDKLNVK
jgi:hypothetical protein